MSGLKRGMSIVECLIIVSIAILVVAISVPAIKQNSQRSKAGRCSNQLDWIRQCSIVYASENGQFPSSLDDLTPNCLPELPVCPSGGAYTLGTADGMPPTCSIPGHSL